MLRGRIWAAAVACAPVFGGAIAPAPAGADDQPPYTDTQARGSITLCDARHHELRSGYVDEIPFVAYAVASQRPQAPYGVKDTSATLYAYQPRQGVPPGEWSGLQLTASSLYKDLDHPTVVDTPGDTTLAEYLENFHTRWQGSVELRIKYKVRNQPVSQEYAAADLRVEGRVWRLLRGGGGTCDSGKALSLGAALLPKVAAGGDRPKTGPHSLAYGGALAALAASHPPSPGQTAVPASEASALPSVSAPPGGANAPGTNPSSSASSSGLAVDRRSGGSASPALALGLGMLGVGVLAGAGWWMRRRRTNNG